MNKTPNLTKCLAFLGLVLIALTVVHCNKHDLTDAKGGKTGGDGKQLGDGDKGDKNDKNGKGDTPAKAGECDGTGTGFTGKYKFSFEGDPEDSCDEASKASMEKLIPADKQYDCTQKDTQFECVDSSEDKVNFKGCIFKSGQFKGDLVKADQETMSFKGNLNADVTKEDGGLYEFTIITKTGDSEGKCKKSGAVSVTKP